MWWLVAVCLAIGFAGGFWLPVLVFALSSLLIFAMILVLGAALRIPMVSSSFAAAIALQAGYFAAVLAQTLIQARRKGRD